MEINKKYVNIIIIEISEMMILHMSVMYTYFLKRNVANVKKKL